VATGTIFLKDGANALIEHRLIALGLIALRHQAAHTDESK
jgi:hypothetical protein